MADKAVNRTYSRSYRTTLSKGGRKPLGTFNSAPVLPKVTRSIFPASKEDSLDDFVVTKKYGRKKKVPNKSDENEEKGVVKETGNSSQTSSEDPSSPGSPPTPVFRVKTDDTFDRLFSGPIKTTYVPKQNPNTSWGSSKEYVSAESSLEKENSNNGLLFASFSRPDYEKEDDDHRKSLAIDDKKKKTKNRGALTKSPDVGPRKTKSATTISSVNEKKKQPRDRLFSEDTLNYVVKGIDAVEISPKPSNDDAGDKEEKDVEASIEVFKSSHQTTEEKLSPFASVASEDSFDLVNSSLPAQTEALPRPRQVSQMISSLKSRPTTMVSPQISFSKSPLRLEDGLGGRAAFDVLHSTPNPFLQQGRQGVTSTPILENGYPLPKPRMSPLESLRSPLISNGVMLAPIDLISRKGGKNWRRSVNVAKFSPSSRVTINPALTLGGLEASEKKRSSGFVFSRYDHALDRESVRRKTCHPTKFTAFPISENEELPSTIGNSIVEPRRNSSFYIEKTRPEVKEDEKATDNGDEYQDLTDLEKVLSRCTTKKVIAFEELYDTGRLSVAKKLGEGTFGEVFLLPTGEPDVDSPVVKIVPVDGTVNVNGQPQTKLQDMLAEIIISNELSSLASQNLAPGFLRVRRCDLTEGYYPQILLDKWDAYHEEKTSENDRPDDKLLDETQKFLVLELNNGGTDLENVVLSTAAQGFAIFQQVAHAIAMAEQSLLFEHRDLHWGNILVRKCDEKVLTFFNGSQQFEVETMNMRATIIDFSLSRMTIQNEGWNIFKNLAEDEELFLSEGDYQFEIYRMMQKHTNNDWRGFYPKTNIFWLHYILDKLVTEVHYKNSKSKIHRSCIAKMRNLKGNILDYSSAYDYVVASNLCDET